MTWEKAWEERRTPWDAGASPPALVELVQSGTLPSGRALVPGCGSGYDVLTLASPDRDVTGLDLSPLARLRFDELRRAAGIPESRARVSVESFFDHLPPEPYDLVWDYTFLCAIDPSQRPAWSRKMAELVRPGGELVTLIFPVTGKPADVGPPFAQDPELVRTLLGRAWQGASLAKVERSHAAREGLEWLARWRRA